MSMLNFIEFAPIATAATGSAYPGLDIVSLNPVPIPGAALFGVIGLRVVGVKLRKHV